MNEEKHFFVEDDETARKSEVKVSFKALCENCGKISDLIKLNQEVKNLNGNS